MTPENAQEPNPLRGVPARGGLGWSLDRWTAISGAAPLPLLRRDAGYSRAPGRPAPNPTLFPVFNPLLYTAMGTAPARGCRPALLGLPTAAATNTGTGTETPATAPGSVAHWRRTHNGASCTMVHCPGQGAAAIHWHKYTVLQYFTTRDGDTARQQRRTMVQHTTYCDTHNGASHTMVLLPGPPAPLEHRPGPGLASGTPL